MGSRASGRPPGVGRSAAAAPPLIEPIGAPRPRQAEGAGPGRAIVEGVDAALCSLRPEKGLADAELRSGSPGLYYRAFDIIGTGFRGRIPARACAEGVRGGSSERSLGTGRRVVSGPSPAKEAEEKKTGSGARSWNVYGFFVKQGDLCDPLIVESELDFEGF